MSRKTPARFLPAGCGAWVESPEFDAAIEEQARIDEDAWK